MEAGLPSDELHERARDGDGEAPDGATPDGEAPDKGAAPEDITSVPGARPGTAMFPLASVLLPHVPIRLRIFEPRYRVMLGRILASGRPEFGVVLIERGTEAGGGEARFGVATMAHIVQMAAQDDDVLVVAQGTHRVEVLAWGEDDPYPVATVRALPELAWDDDLEPLREQTEHLVRGVLARAAEFAETDWDPDVGLSEDPVEAAWQLAAIAPIGPLDRYRLLRAGSAEELLSTTRSLTEDALDTLEPTLGGDTVDQALWRWLDEDGGA